MDSHTAQVDDLRLVALPNAVSCADMFVRFSLAEWSLRLMQDEAIYVTCHLVAAVVDHSDPRAPGFITVRLRLRGDCLVIEVEDDHPSPTIPSPVLNGRRAGVLPVRGRGTLVWCELPLPAHLTAAAVPLPQREPRRSPAAEAERLAGEPTGVDPAIMERILYGLSRPAGHSLD
ncbi:ATP-binding protein [Solihabitans fulvus]|uniref:ATP-binding protein n=1 Tax=Solihabitans fulvus TaxID=1892852 RepID=A0A5B2X4A2_9PSEU|nr:ATP-binding protein [Solihabitans fulvus]KAA2258029.1 ATP-binding protein [Solihabitans fulvus]